MHGMKDSYCAWKKFNNIILKIKKRVCCLRAFFFINYMEKCDPQKMCENWKLKKIVFLSNWMTWEWRIKKKNIVNKFITIVLEMTNFLPENSTLVGGKQNCVQEKP